MKKLASILVMVFAFTFATQAQKKRKQERPQLTVEQHTDLAIKQMTLALDLSEKQQYRIKPMIATKMAERKAFMEKRKEARKDKKRPTSDEIYAMKSKMLDNKIAVRNNMKEILNKEQFEKFEKMQKKRKMKGKKMMKKGKKGERGERGKKRNKKE
ncbi:hypothetical protein H9I45_08045 [Polaribacter haliotis]|uniref:DUF4890 domain-containing protein n=1 Tax=Polaribacter haliotis TaxID=1888915 RepID=A0A7L8AK35_9FLAO|nr:hypothetical protein [Polaribacter haliotis]QOD62380.1 hypothetical protein H9I45_08045 [Polaribacter haliotis]